MACVLVEKFDFSGGCCAGQLKKDATTKRVRECVREVWLNKDEGRSYNKQ
jgi:hypothetical protein